MCGHRASPQAVRLQPPPGPVPTRPPSHAPRPHPQVGSAHPSGLVGSPQSLRPTFIGPRLLAGLCNPGVPGQPQLDRGARNTMSTETFLSWFAPSILQPLQGPWFPRLWPSVPPGPLVQSPLLSPHYAPRVLLGPRSLWRPRLGSCPHGSPHWTVLSRQTALVDPLNNRGLNCKSLLTCRFFSINKLATFLELCDYLKET